MSLGKKLQKVVQKLFQEILKLSRAITKGVMSWLLRSFLVLGRRSSLTRAGFILPTVIMVILVVTLLVTAIVLRSFDRTKTARFYKVDQTVMAAAAPAIDRAKAKLDTLFQDPRLPRSTPSDLSLYNLFASDDTKYVFSDETRLKLAYDLTGNKQIIDEVDGLTKGTSLDQIGTTSTAWRFPVDTDNNGLYDSLTLYSIAFRSPGQKIIGNTVGFDRARKPLDARTPPMDDGTGTGICQTVQATSADLVSTTGWYKSGSKLKKSIFVYTTTVPITNYQALGFSSKYENYKGQPGFSSLEYQQDRSRIPLANNAVVYQDDLHIGAGDTFDLNGSIVANSNLFLSPTVVSGGSSASTTLLQVSSPKSCFYQPENSKITVGGNLVNAVPIDTTGTGFTYNTINVPVDLYKNQQTPDQSQKVNQSNQSVAGSETSYDVLYNSQAYTARISQLVNAWVSANPTPNPPASNPNDPQVVIDQVDDKSVPVAQKAQERLDALTSYFQERTRRVPFKEVSSAKPDTLTGKVPVGSGNTLRPPKEWMYPIEPSDGQSSPGTYGQLALNISAPKVQPPATEPQTLKNGDPTQGYIEYSIGDRISVGNNLPANWYKLSDYNQYSNSADTTGIFVSGLDQTDQELQAISNTLWDKDSSSPKKTRGRFTGVQSLSDVGDKSRNGFWETNAAEAPQNRLDGNGGLRVVTGAGVYERKGSFLPPPYYDNSTTPQIEYSTTYDDPSTPTITEQYPIVWPDSMPMSPGQVSKVFDNSNPGTDPFNPTNWTSLPVPPALPIPLPALAGPTIDPINNTDHYAKGDLRMRATVVYHYAQDSYAPSATPAKPYQKPIACISSYYDPTDQYTSQNLPNLPSTPNLPNNAKGKSNNGIVYGPPSISAATLGGATDYNNSTGLFGTAPDGTEQATTLRGQLYYQANLVFPNGRFVNEPLRTALHNIATGNTPTLSDQSAIDSTICALDILASRVSISTNFINHGTIQETAFLDARQIQAIDKDDPSTYPVETFTAAQPVSTGVGNANLSTKYDLSLEERKPLEVRVTQLDLDQLRQKTVQFGTTATPPAPSPEYLLPNSGIIYATRDDALPDLSAPLPPIGGLIKTQQQQKTQQLSQSSVDYKLDPTRRVSGIMLVNGQYLARGNSNQSSFNDAEKGLILVSNLPAYVWANQAASGQFVFNPHSQQEFTDNSGFYQRQNNNSQFACRPNDPRLPSCTTGDTWRPATVIADSVGLLSGNFRPGFRNEGDYDLRNNHGDQASIDHGKQNGFLTNNYATNGLSSNQTPGASSPFAATTNLTDSTYSSSGTLPNNSGSSYFNNFTTPVQRRGSFPEYVMEMCRKLPVSECAPNDWFIDVHTVGSINNPTEKNQIRSDHFFPTFNPSQPFTPASVLSSPPVPSAQLIAGTTAKPPLDPADQHYPRRIAFLRDPNYNQLVMTDWNGGGIITYSTPIALGINSSGQVQLYPYTQTPLAQPVPNPAQNQNALWFRTTSDTTGQPTKTVSITYNNISTDRLYYLPPSNQPLYLPPVGTPTPNGRERLLLPDIVSNLATFYPSGTPPVVPNFLTAATNLNNVVGGDSASSYALCITGQVTTGAGSTPGASSKTSIVGPYRPANPAFNPPNPASVNSGCPSAIATNIYSAVTSLTSSLRPAISLAIPGIGIANPPSITLPLVIRNDVDASNFYTYGLGTIAPNKTLVLQGNRDTIFVFKINTPAISFNGFTLTLNGVDPNNIFWVFSGSNVSITGSTLAGNFLGDPTSTFTIDSASQILGGRILGFGRSPSTINSTAKIRAIASNQPLLVPVLETHLPSGNTYPSTTTVAKTNWQQPAKNSTFNLVIAAGNTPPRPTEFDGGVASFPRFLENWTNATTTITGSLMEFNRSAYATSPFTTISNTGSSSDILAYPQKYSTVNGAGTVPSYSTPKRQWGYDVGLLSQLPDLFASRFTSPAAGSPNEFFRQVGRDDDWVSTLLCGKVIPPNGSNTTTTYKSSQNAINSDQRPTTFCNTYTDL